MDDHGLNRCDACPCPADVICSSHQLPFFCQWARSGDAARRAHIVGRSRLASEARVLGEFVAPSAPAPPPARIDPMDCAWLGAPTGDLVECPTCSGTVKLKVFACQLFETTHSRQCAACHERLPREEGPPPGLARSEATPQYSPPDIPPDAFPSGARDGGAG
jgi:hypothetical protein